VGGIDVGGARSCGISINLRCYGRTAFRYNRGWLWRFFKKIPDVGIRCHIASGIYYVLEAHSINANLEGVRKLGDVYFGENRFNYKGTPRDTSNKTETKVKSNENVEGKPKLKDKKRLDKYKEAILLEDDRVKFVYELVDLKNSKPNELVYKGLESGLTLEQVKKSKGNIKYKAMELYIKNERLEDEKIEKLITTYNEILQYEEDKKVQEQYQKFLDNKGEDMAITKLETSKQGIIEDIEELRNLRKTHIEENQKIIESIK